MSLSPYLNPTNLNSSLQTTNKVGQFLYPEGYDKRTHGALGTVRHITQNIVDTIKDVSDSIANAAGSRSPMYIIGEIDTKNNGVSDIYDTDLGVLGSLSQYVPDEVNGMVRAIQKIQNGVFQQGVIIDGLGDIDGTMEVSYTTNPAYFMSDSIVDQRYRMPTKLKMTVMVSNYLTDDMGDVLADTVSALDPTGLLGNLKSNLAYGGNTRAQAALYKLRWLMENAHPFTVYTPHGVYDNMLIKRLRPSTDASKMDMLYCDIEFQEMIFYVPYTNKPGLIPARQGIEEPREGLTKRAVDKIKEWL